MNLDALPYTTFIVLLEFCVGTLAVCVLADWRGRVAASFVKLCAAMVNPRWVGIRCSFFGSVGSEPPRNSAS